MGAARDFHEPPQKSVWKGPLCPHNPAVRHFTGHSQCHQRVQHFGDARAVGAGEGLGDFLGGEGLGAGGEVLADGLDLFGAGSGPGGFLAGGGFLRGGGGDFVFGFGEGHGDLGGRAAGGVLELGAEPADEAALFLLGPLGVERDQFLEDLAATGRRSPSTGGYQA